MKGMDSNMNKTTNNDKKAIDDEKPKYSAPAVRKVLEMLELMARGDKSFSVSDVVNELDITSNSVFRIFKELELKGYVVKNPVDSTHELTPKLYYLGNSIRSRISLAKTAYPYMKSIRQFTKETVLLTTFGGQNDTLVVDQIESREPIKFLSTIGVTYDSYSSAMGKAMLSSLDEAELVEYFASHQLVKKTENTISSWDELLRQLTAIKKEGVAYDREENMYGLSCIACPVFSMRGQLEGSIGISGLTFRMGEETIKESARFIRKQAWQLSSTLGYEQKQSFELI